jgi:hypothetical protein
MLQGNAIRPSISNILFNDPNLHSAHITLTMPAVVPPYLDPIAAFSPSGDDLGPRLVVPDEVHSQRQGETFSSLARLVVTVDHLFAPRGNPPSTPNVAANQLRVGGIDLLPNLAVGIKGPTTMNAQAMQASPTNGVLSNRSSTILSMQTVGGTDDFTALFTGDSHDRLPLFCDIRSNGSTAAQHFMIMKVPHHGSDNSNDPAFYHHYTAQYYLISSNWNNHKHPAAQTIQAIIEGLGDNGKLGINPIMITTSRWGRGIERGLVPLIKAMLRTSGVDMYCFLATTESIDLQFVNGQLQDGWSTGLIQVPTV